MSDRFLDTEDIPAGCSVLVVGAGMSGLGTALELAERGVRDILVTDHGPFDGYAHRTRTPEPGQLPGLPAPWSSTSSHYADMLGVVSPVGGRSRCWHGVVLPISRDVLERHWPHDTAHRLLGTGPGSYEFLTKDLTDWQAANAAERPNSTDDDPRDELRALWPDLVVHPVPRAGWSVDGPYGRVVWAYSPLLSWTGRGFGRHRVDEYPRLVPRARAVRVLVEEGRARGVVLGTAAGEERQVRADVVVLAAGTLENTRLYAQSLGAAGEVITRWPGLNDHVTHGLAVPLPVGLADRWTRCGRRLLWSDHEAQLNANLFMEVHAGGLPEPVLDLWWMAQQELPFGNEIRFAPDSGGAEPWPGRIDAFLSVADEAAIRQRDAVADTLIDALDVSVGTETGFDDFEPAARAAVAAGRSAHYVARLGTADHEAGTLPLGRHVHFGGRSAVIDGLFVTGPATFPATGAANPSLTILALAAHTAEAISCAH